MNRSKIDIFKYEGGNAFIDHLIGDDETWYIVNGPVRGRRPVQADSKEEALAVYLNESVEDDVDL